MNGGPPLRIAQRLLQGGIDRTEDIIQVAAKAVDRNDDRDGDAGCEPAVQASDGTASRCVT